MKNFILNKKRFLIIILSNFILSLCWTYLAILNNEFAINDKGLITGLGYLLIFCISIFVSRSSEKIGKLILLTIGVISIFLFTSFGLGFLIIQFTQSLIIYSMIASVLSSTLLVLLLDKLFKIQIKLITLFSTCLFSMMAYFLIDLLSHSFSLKLNIEPRMTMFLIYQGMIILPLAAGLETNKASI